MDNFLLGLLLVLGIYFSLCIILYLISNWHNLMGSKLSSGDYKGTNDSISLSDKNKLNPIILKEAAILEKSERKRLAKIEIQKDNRLLSLSHRQFEDLVAEMFKMQGYSVEQTPYSADGGKDAILRKDNKKYLVECKHYGRQKKIGRPQLQKLFAAMTEEGADKGIFVTTGGFAGPATEYAEKYNIELIDLDLLKTMIKDAFHQSDQDDYINAKCLECGDSVKIPRDAKAVFCRNSHIVLNKFVNYKPSVDDITGDKDICKKCGNKLVLRKGPYGNFWGCVGYPKCDYTKNVNRQTELTRNIELD